MGISQAKKRGREGLQSVDKDRIKKCQREGSLFIVVIIMVPEEALRCVQIFIHKKLFGLYDLNVALGQVVNF